MNNGWIIVIPIAVMIGAIILLIIMFSQILGEIFRHEARKSLRENIRSAVITSQLPWDKLTILWKGKAFLTQNDVTDVLRSLVTASYTGGDKEIKPYEATLEAYFKTSELKDSYVGLPEDIRLPVERYISGGEELIKLLPIINGVRSFIRMHEKESLLWKIVSFTSFVVTIASLVFGIYAFYHPRDTASILETKETAISQMAVSEH